MDFVEEATQRYLQSLNLGAIVREPCGKDTFPDFSVGGSIAVECTRLVHSVELDGKNYTATELEPRIAQSLRNSIEKKRPSSQEISAFVCVSYDLRIDQISASRELGQFLDDLALSFHSLPAKFEIDRGLEIEIISSTEKFDTPFKLGVIAHRNNAIWVLHELIVQSIDAINRKSVKIDALREYFEEFWLAVSSDLTISVPDEGVAELAQALRFTGYWSKLLLIDPFNPERSRIIPIRA